MLNENYIFLSVCVYLNTFYLRWSSFGIALNSFFSIICGSISLGFPIFVPIFYGLKRNFNRILSNDENFLSRFCGILKGLNFKRRGRKVLVYFSAALLIKLWLAFIVVFNQNQQTFNIIMVNIQTILIMIVSGYTEAMADSIANHMNHLNETFVLLFTYHLY